MSKEFPTSKSVRHSILSDPRLSQLFQLSNQLEELADSIGKGKELKMNSNDVAKTPNGNQPLVTLATSCTNNSEDIVTTKSEMSETESGRIEYQRLSSNNEDEMTCRSSVLSEDMSTSSGHSLLKGHEDEVGQGLDGQGRGVSSWQDRCVELEASLQKFRDQAQNIRELLREKLAELEHRVVEAEIRAEDAELKVRSMERQFDNNKSEDDENVGDKDKIIQTLESEVEQQRRLRLADAKQVEAKAARIKDWVTNKLKELEEQNQHLKVQNAHCNEQMELLKVRLEQLQVMGAETQSSKRQSRECMSGSLESGTSKINKMSVDSLDSKSSSSNRRQTEKAKDSAKLKDSKKSELSSRPVPPPRNKFNATVPNLADQEFGIDGGNLTKSACTSHLHQMRPESACNVADSVANGSSTNGGGRFSESCDLPEKHRSLHMPPMGSLELKKLSKKNPPLLMSDELNDYSEIYTPNNEESARNFVRGWRNEEDVESMSAESNGTGTRTGSGDSGLTGLSTGTEGGKDTSTNNSCSQQQRQQDPPPRPLHRYPSWEDRIYQVASEGFQDQQHESRNQHSNSNENRHSLCYGHDNISVPVYASVKGLASQIRSVPFSGNSDDESDEEEEEEDIANGEEEEEDNNDTGRGTNTTSSSTSAGDISLASPRTAGVQNNAKSPCFKFANALTVQPPQYSVANSNHHHHHVPAVIGSASTNASNYSNFANKSTTSSLKQDDCSDDGSDYAVPPDAGLTPPDGGVSPGNSLLTCPSPGTTANCGRISACLSAESPRKGSEKTLEKSGYLAKLGGKIKSWKRRYFVLKNGTLSFWKSQHECHRKPQGIIVLDETCRVFTSAASNTFEIATKTKTFYMTAESAPLMDEWVRVLQNVIQRNALKLLLSNEDQKPTLQGWLTKVKHGHTKKCWCVLIGKMFIYFRGPNEQNPIGQINMRDTRVEQVEQISDSDSEENDKLDNLLLHQQQSISAAKPEQPTLGIFPNHIQDGPTYLIFGSAAEKEKWQYELTVVSGGNPKVGTQYEMLVQKLMEEDGNPESALWKHPMLVYSKEPNAAPLTTLTKDSLQTEALKLFKSLQLFTSVVMDSAGIDYHVMLAANAFQQCLDMPELQPEFLCALVKQTSTGNVKSAGSCDANNDGSNNTKNSNTSSSAKSKSHKRSFLKPTSLFSHDHSHHQVSGIKTGSDSSTLVYDNKSGSAGCASTNCVLMQGWMLMAMAVSIFVPRDSKILWFLRTHFARNKDSKTETGKYAAYCARALERSVINGPRLCRPSRMEVLSILLKNPHQHSLPHALPVHFMNDTYHVVGYDGSTNILEFVDQLTRDIGFRSSDASGFVIYSDDPIDKDLDHALHPEDKVCDVISRWETALREKGSGKFENKRVIRFTFKSRTYWRRNASGENDKERLLLAYQVASQIVNGQFPLNKELAFELCALMAQIHYGDLSSERNSQVSNCSGNNVVLVNEALNKFYPERYLIHLEQDEELLRESENLLMNKWTSLKHKNSADCVRIFLTCTRKWQFFGAKLFEVQTAVGAEMQNVFLAVGEDGISILDFVTMQLINRYGYDNIATFGGCQDDFVLVLNSSFTDSGTRVSQDSGDGTEKLLFHTRKSEILAITLLIADYMNMIVRMSPGLLHAPATPKLSSLSRGSSMRTCSRLATTSSNSRSKTTDSTSLFRAGSFISNDSQVSSKVKKRMQLDSGVA